jgi:hypothetical protein
MGFEAAGETAAKVSILEDGRVLNGVGLTVDIIQRVGSLVSGSWNRGAVDSNWLEHENLMGLCRHEIEFLKECDDIASAA